MKNLMFILSAFIFTSVNAAVAKYDQQRADEVAMLLLKTLKSKLTDEMTKGGPINALKFCSLEATKLTQDVNSKIPKGWTLKRVSDRNRNPSNAPDALDQVALKFFEGSTEKSYSIEETSTDSKFLASRYYKAIRIEATCLQCHGTNLSAGLKSKLEELYPQDKAVGYQIGQLRGVVRVRIPAQ